MSKKTQIAKVVATAVFWTALLTGGASLFSAFAELLGRVAGESSLDKTTPVVTEPRDDMFEHNVAYPMAHIYLQTFDPHALRLSGSIQIEVPTSFAQKLADERGMPLSSDAAFEVASWSNSFQPQQVRLDSLSISPDGKTLASGSNRFEISLSGDVASYPLERYTGYLTVSLRAPKGATLSNSSGVRVPAEVPLKLGVTAAPTLGGFDASTEPPKQAGSSTSVEYVKIQLRRSAALRRVVGTVLLSLFAFLAIIVVDIYADQRSRKRDWAMITAIAALAIAVLPLRGVLVPPDLGTFTAVDTVLTLHFLLMIGVAGYVLMRSWVPARR